MAQHHQWGTMRFSTGYSAEVTIQKKKGITWLKGIFWLSWEELRQGLPAILGKIQVETSLKVCGLLASHGPSEIHPGVDILDPHVDKMILLQVPSRINEKPVVHVKEEEIGWGIADAFLAKTLHSCAASILLWYMHVHASL